MLIIIILVIIAPTLKPSDVEKSVQISFAAVGRLVASHTLM